MALPTDPGTITHAIQLAVAPVFLLTAVAGMIGAVAGRLARIIDRARVVEARADQGSTDPEHLARALRELVELRTRGQLANGCIALLTLCGFLIGTTIILLFVGEALDLGSARLAVGSFLFAILCFLAALVCFLVETWIATRLLNFRLLR
jgi:hypothetical protein